MDDREQLKEVLLHLMEPEEPEEQGETRDVPLILEERW